MPPQMNNEPTPVDEPTPPIAPQPVEPAVQADRPAVPRRRFIMLLISLIGIGLLLQYQRNIQDWWILRNYQAPAAVSALASSDTMTTQARDYFYVNRPAIDDKSSFKNSCPSDREQTIVLGCYHSNQAGIYLLNVTDSRLSGVMQVTAAHEMLHAAYDRLSTSERNDVDRQLQQFYDTGLKDERVRATIEAYKKTEPNDVVNEMHSVFGTEVRNLPPSLESYYKQYFSNRLQIVSYAEHYAQEFTSRQQQVAAYDAQLKSMKQTIDSQTATLQAQAEQLAATRRQLEAERATADPATFNASVTSYNSQVASYNAAVTQLRNLIDTYNTIVNRRNAIALEEQQLAQAIQGDSLPTTQ